MVMFVARGGVTNTYAVEFDLFECRWCNLFAYPTERHCVEDNGAMKSGIWGGDGVEWRV